MKLKHYLPAAIAVVFLILAAAYFYKVESDYISGMSTTIGSVWCCEYTHTSNNTGRNGSSKAIISFRVDSKRYKVSSRSLRIPGLGNKVEVYFNPNDPSEARINRIDETYFFTLIALFFLLMGFVGTIPAFLFYQVKRIRG